VREGIGKKEVDLRFWKLVHLASPCYIADSVTVITEVQKQETISPVAPMLKVVQRIHHGEKSCGDV
jgi:hypothetical protein